MSEPKDPKAGPDRRRVVAWAGVIAAAAGGGGLALARYVGTRDAETARGYGRDPNLLEPARQPWPEVLTERQRTTIAALMDTVLPASADHPAPSAVGLVGFFEEWLSAPYPVQAADRTLLVPMIERLATSGFNQGRPEARRKACERADADPAKRPVFRRFVELTAGAYCVTPEGAALVGYIGNAPSETFEGPPPDVIARLERLAEALPRPGA